MRDTLVVGTAGHIDHGKTTLVEMLTGENGDRLAEEKARGMTINLGFTHWTLDSDHTIAFVDVPGHEKFVKTMVAGAIGIDAVLLVVAADEGVMPQTEEHFRILLHLPVVTGAIVVTKCDLADEARLSETEAEIRALTKGSFLEGAPIFRSDFRNPERIKRSLSDFFIQLMSEMTIAEGQTVSRLYTDRVFTVKGHGTVVTGTLLDGRICLGDTLYVYTPARVIQVKVRNLQVHGSDVNCVHSGQRAAINLSESGAEKGSLISSSPDYEPSDTMDVWVEVDPQVKEGISHWQRLRLHHGTSEILCRIALKGKGTIASGESAAAQLRLENPIYAKAHDVFVLRRFSPVETLGGGYIIHPKGERGKWQEAIDTEDDLRVLMHTAERLNQPFERRSAEEAVPLDGNQMKSAWEEALKTGEIKALDGDRFCTGSWFEAVSESVLKETFAYHKAFPLRRGILLETLRSRIKGLDKNTFKKVVAELTASEQLRVTGNDAALFNRTVDYSPEMNRVKEAIMKAVREADGAPIGIKALEPSTGDKKAFTEMLYHLINIEILVKINEETVMDAAKYLNCRTSLIQTLNESGTITVAEFRDQMGISRKNSVILLEHFDAVHLTKRMEDKRILLKR
ncbi:MAG: selenocysteine-specific elongation factor [Clostridiales bacterium]|nr:selenocysteine-specific elongation factor [Clostridiales bacterium]